MQAPWSGQLSAAKTGWLVMLIFFGWLGYLLVPAPKPEPSSPPTPVKTVPSRLVALGLPDNPDLERLPEYFSLFADQGKWENDKTIFAYWNPGSNSYSYFFEATKVNGKYLFKTVSEPLAAEPESEEIYASGLRWGNNLPKECLLRFLYADEPIRADYQYRANGIHERPTPTVEVKIEHSDITLPSPNLNLPSTDLDQKR